MMKSSICTLLMCLTISVMAQENFVQHDLIEEYLTGFEVGDFDNDGDLDVFGVWLQYEAPNRIFLYRNVGGQGADLFQKEIIDLENEGSHHVAVADMDNDGDLDAVLSGEDTNSIALFSNNGDGTFTEIPLGITGGTQVEIADYEGDGDLDIITLDTENRQVFVHIDNGGNQFSTLTSKTVADDPEDIALGDIDGDGDTDIALVFGFSFGKQVVVLENKGFTILTEKVLYEDNLRSADEIYVADMNNDNRQDIVVLDQKRVSIFTNLNNLSFDYQSYEDPNNTSDFLTGLGLGDFNGDGKIDMCVSDLSQSEIVWFKNNYANGIYDFQVAGEVGRYTGTRNFRSADFDLDGDLDVVSTAADFAWHENQVTQIEPPFTVFDAIAESPDHTTLETAIIAAELSVDLDNEGGIFTIFAPTDAAFEQLPAGTLDALLDDPTGELKDILLYHVLDNNVPSSDLVNGQTAMTLNGKDITVTIDNNGIFINQAEVTIADIITDNGVVHVIDAVLSPPRTTIFDIIQESPDHTTLETAIIAAELDDDLNGADILTVFAPTDAAFAQLPAGTLDALLDDPTGELTQTLLYHVVGGNVLSTDLSNGQTATTLNGEDITVAINNNGIFINEAEVTVADIMTDNGVVHVIDAVLMIPRTTIFSIIQDSPDHTTLETAILAAGLDDELEGEAPLTVFAPTDGAFAELPAGALDALLDDPTGALAQVLLYHVVDGNVLSTDLMDGQSVTTLNGESVTVAINNNTISINDSEVTTADIQADNGVVHIVSTVIQPPNSINNIPAIPLKAYPNPVTNVLTIEMPNELLGQTVTASLIDNTGKTIQSFTLAKNTNTVSVLGVPKGIYHLSIEANDIRAYQMISIQ